MLRFGLLGTGYWAAETHAAGLHRHPDAQFVGVWGRNPAKAEALAARYGVRAYPDVDALIADVDALAVALPPDIQAEMALRAARAGRAAYPAHAHHRTRGRVPGRGRPAGRQRRGRDQPGPARRARRAGGGRRDRGRRGRGGAGPDGRGTYQELTAGITSRPMV